MGFFVVLAEHCSNSPFSVGNFATMTYENIAQAFRAANRDGRGGNFVGPGPRVTRRSAMQDLGTLTLPHGCMTQTSAAWLYEYTEPPADIDRTAYVKTIQNQMRSDLQRTLSSTAVSVGGDWAPPVFVDYNSELNGHVEYWLSGQATNTRTRNGPDVGAEENRVGPDNAPQFQRRDTVPNNKWWLLGGAAIIGTGVILYVGWKASKLEVFGPRVTRHSPLTPLPEPYGPNPYGPNPYGPNPYGPNPYGPNPYGPNPYGPNPYGRMAYGKRSIHLPRKEASTKIKLKSLDKADVKASRLSQKGKR